MSYLPHVQAGISLLLDLRLTSLLSRNTPLTVHALIYKLAESIGKCRC